MRYLWMIIALGLGLTFGAQAQETDEKVEDAVEAVEATAEKAVDAAAEGAEKVEVAAEAVKEEVADVGKAVADAAEQVEAKTEAVAEEVADEVKAEGAEATEETAEGEEEVAEEEATGAPNIEVDEPSYDFGEVETGETIEHTFTVKNSGDAELVISRVKPSCGCTVANISSKNLAPGETAEITASLNLKGRKGRQRKSIRVDSNDPDAPQTVLFIEGTAVSDITIKPERVLFNQIDGTVPVSETIEITAAKEDGSFNVTEVTSTSEDFTTELETVEAGKSYKLTVTTKAPLDKPMARATIQVRTDNPKQPVISIPAIAQVMQILSYSPQEILVMGSADSPITRDVWITTGKVKEFEVTAATLDDPDVTITINANPGNRVRVRLENLTPKEDLGDKKLKITTTAPGMENIEIPFRVIQPARQPKPPAPAAAVPATPASPTPAAAGSGSKE